MKEVKTYTKSTRFANRHFQTLRLADGHFDLENCTFETLIASRVRSLRLRDCISDGGDTGVLCIGSSNIHISGHAARNHRVGISICPGHPWTFEEEVAARVGRWFGPGGGGIDYKDENRWKAGWNLQGTIFHSGKGIEFVADGRDAFIPYHTGEATAHGVPPYRTDLLKGHRFLVHGVGPVEPVGESTGGFTVRGNFVKGVRYTLHNFNPRYESRNVRIIDGFFDSCTLAGIESYFVNGAEFRGNVTNGTIDDYQIGVEHGRNILVKDNTMLDGLNPRFGMIGYAENIKVLGNNYDSHFGGRGAWMENVTSDRPVKVIGWYPALPNTPQN